MNELEKSTTYSLYKQGDDITDRIALETDVSKAEDLKQEFKFNQMKKNIARINFLTKARDIADNEMMERLANTPEAIENKELVQMFNAISTAITNTTDTIEKTPIIQINNQEINITNTEVPGLSRASREKVLDVISQILKTDDFIDVEVEEVDDDEERCI